MGELKDILAEPIDLDTTTQIRKLQRVVPHLLSDAGLLTAEYCRLHHSSKGSDHTILEVTDIMLASICEDIPKSDFMGWVSRLYDEYARTHSIEEDLLGD